MVSISERIITLENENNLWNLKIQGIFIWELIRLDIYLMAQEVGSSEKFVPKFDTKSIAKTRFKRVIRNIFRSPFFGKSNELIFESARKYKLDGNKYEDLYTFFLKNNMFLENPLYIETTLDYDNFDSNKKHIDSIIFLSGILKKLIRVKLLDEEIIALNSLELLFYEKLGIEIQLIPFVKNIINQFTAEKTIYKFLLKLRRPEKVFFIGYNRFHSLVSACKQFGIESIEIQHGLILKESLIYHFPNVKKNHLRYFPDKFLMWADFPYNTGELPISEENISKAKENHLNYMLKIFSDIKKEDQTILIISQPMHSKSLINYLLNNLENLKNFKILYKLHPMEFYKEGFDDILFELNKFENVEIIRNEFSVYELLKRAKYILGIYSTTLFEADFFGCNVIVLDIDENDFAASLRQNSNVVFLKMEESIVKYL